MGSPLGVAGQMDNTKLEAGVITRRNKAGVQTDLPSVVRMRGGISFRERISKKKTTKKVIPLMSEAEDFVRDRECQLVKNNKRGSKKQSTVKDGVRNGWALRP